MAAIAGSLVAYLRLNGKKVLAVRVFNILGVTFFLPFVVLQPLDLIVITTIGWNLAIIPPLHTLVLVWEAIATMEIIDRLHRIAARDRTVGVALIVGVWILVDGLLWR